MQRIAETRDRCRLEVKHEVGLGMIDLGKRWRRVIEHTYFRGEGRVTL